jgi:hypothetical protein
MQLLQDYLLNATFDSTDVNLVRLKITEAVSAVLKPEYDRVASLIAGTTASNLPLGEALVGIYVGGRPHLFELAANGLVTDHHVRNFAAIGAGKPFAEHAATIFRDLPAGMTLHQAKMLAFRMVQDAIEAAGPNIPVGGPVQMASVSPGPPPTPVLLQPDDPALKDAVDGWMAAEAMRFQEHLPPGEEPPPPS